MSKIAFLGLGHMGTPMASRLINAGHDVTVWNRGRQRTAPLAGAGARVAASPAEAAAGIEFAITMLANPDALGAVLFGPVLAEPVGVDLPTLLERTDRLGHGTTIGTSAVLERSGARVTGLRVDSEIVKAGGQPLHDIELGAGHAYR